MKKSFLNRFLYLILFVILTSLVDKGNNKKFCQFKLYINNSSSVTLPYVEFTDMDETYPFFNIPSYTEYGVGFTLDSQIEIVVWLPSVHPSGRIKIINEQGQT